MDEHISICFGKQRLRFGRFLEFDSKNIRIHVPSVSVSGVQAVPYPVEMIHRRLDDVPAAGSAYSGGSAPSAKASSSVMSCNRSARTAVTVYDSRERGKTAQICGVGGFGSAWQRARPYRRRPPSGLDALGPRTDQPTGYFRYSSVFLPDGVPVMYII
jgi:hypothetical protein